MASCRCRARCVPGASATVPANHSRNPPSPSPPSPSSPLLLIMAGREVIAQVGSILQARCCGPGSRHVDACGEKMVVARVAGAFCTSPLSLRRRHLLHDSAVYEPSRSPSLPRCWVSHFVALGSGAVSDSLLRKVNLYQLCTPGDSRFTGAYCLASLVQRRYLIYPPSKYFLPLSIETRSRPKALNSAFHLVF
jgi:hypothetical protein